MKIYFDQPYPLLLIALCALLAIAVAFLLYKKSDEHNVFTRLQQNILLLLRSISLFCILFLMLGPALQWVKNYRTQPVLLLAIDNSQSVQKSQKQCEDLIKRAKDNFNDARLEVWTFGENARSNEHPDFSEARSDYSNLLNNLNDHYLVSDIGSLIIIGDGSYNSGDDPVFKSRSLPFPVYTIGVGDTTIREDALILRVNSNKTVFLDSYFPVEVDLSFVKAMGRSVKFSIYQGDSPVYERIIYVPSNDYYTQERINLKASLPGNNHYEARIESLPEEENTINNRFGFSIHVITQKHKILFWQHGPHPDIAAIAQAIQANSGYQCDFVSGVGPQVSFDGYDLIIAHQMPDSATANSPSYEEFKKYQKPVWIMVGQETSFNYLNNLEWGITFSPAKGVENATSRINENFNLFSIENKFSELAENWPPLTVPFCDVKMSDDLQALIFQNLQNTHTHWPLLAAGHVKGFKRGFLLGEGIWRWRIHNYLQSGSHQAFDKLIQQFVNYLMIDSQEDKFSVYYQPIYAEDTPVVLQAKLLNDSFEPLTEPDVHLQLESEKGTGLSYLFDKSANQYRLDIGKLPQGTYTFTAHANLGDKELQKTGSFSVTPLQLEQSQTNANFQALYQMAQNTGGQFFTSENFDQLNEELKLKQQLKEGSYSQLLFRKLITMKWLFFFVLLVLSLEWFLKKYWGSY